MKLSRVFANTILTALAVAILSSSSHAQPTTARKTTAPALPTAKKESAQPVEAPKATETLHALTLTEAVATAIKNNPLVKETNATVEAADAQVPVTRATILPNLNLLGSVTERTDPVDQGNGGTFQGNSYNLYNTDLRLTQPLFQIGTLSAIDSVKKDLSLRKLDLEITERNLTAQVIQAYFTVVLDMRNLDTLNRNQAIEREALETATRRERTGRAQTLDVLQIRTQLALLKSQIATAENAQEVASATLASLLGDEDAHILRVRDRLDAPDLHTVDAQVDLTKFHLPELEQNKIEIAQVDDQKRVALGQNLPYLSLQADYLFSSYKRDDLFENTSSSWAATVNLTIPLFSGLSSIYQQQVLNANKSKLEFDRQNIVNTTDLNQVSARKNLETAEQSIIEGREALRLAVASSDEARRMFKLATIDFLQLLTIEQAYVQAEQAFNTYKYNYVAALATYYVNSGQDLGALVQTLEGANQ